MAKKTAKAPAAEPTTLGLQGDRVRVRREALGMTQTGLAHATAGHASNISGIETGRFDVYTVKLTALAIALKCSTDYLVGLVDDPTPHNRK